MHFVLIRHGTRIDKVKHGISPGQSKVSLDQDKNLNNIDDNIEEESANWLSNFDPPLNEEIASHEMESAFKKISTNLLGKNRPGRVMIHSSPYNRCIQTSELLLNKLKNNSNQTERKFITKLRVDQALSEWLNENYNLKYLPPNDDGYSMINNVNAYLYSPVDESACKGDFSSKTKNQLRDVKDSTWSYNRLGHCGEYGESSSSFTKRCFGYLIKLLQFYHTNEETQTEKNMVIFIISHGAVISTLLQILLGRSVFNEIPLCTPIYFKQSEKRKSVFRLMDYDFNLSSLLSPPTDKDFYKILETPIDLTKLDQDNLRSELTIGTSGYTTIIQSIPKQLESPKLGSAHTRRRRNTINIGDKEKGNVQDEGLESLKQTMSSKQLYLLNKDTSEEKVIDLDKLHNFFGGGSDSDSNSDNDADNVVGVNAFDFDEGRSLKDNVYKGSITSLSSFNEENKSKFQLNMKNFYSKPQIKNDPYSHFFLSRSSTVDDEMVDVDGVSMRSSVSRGTSQNVKNDMFTFNEDSDSDTDSDTDKEAPSQSGGVRGDASQTEGEHSDTDSEGHMNVLSFGRRGNLSGLKDGDNPLVTPSDRTDSGTVLNGTFRNQAIGSSAKLWDGVESSDHRRTGTGGADDATLGGNASHARDTCGAALQETAGGSKIKLVTPRLISTRNLDLLVRGGDSADDPGVGDARSKRGSSHETLRQWPSLSRAPGPLRDFGGLHFDTDSSAGEGDDDDDDGGGWFGGFSS